MTKTSIRPDAEILRKKAEEILEGKLIEAEFRPQEAEILKLIHEFEVYQIELEMQNEELSLARTIAQETTEKYIELYDFAPSGYYTLSKEGLIMELNLSGSIMLGKECILLKNHQFVFFVSNNSKPIFNRFLGNVFNSEVKETCEVEISVSGKLPLIVQLTGVVKGSNGNCFITAIDITDRKRMEEELLINKSKYQAIFEATGTATLIVEEDTTIRMANNECFFITGYSPTELIGQKWIDFVSQESLTEMMKNHQLRFKDSTQAPKKYQVKLVNKKGEIRDAILNIGMKPGTKQSIVSILDITELKQAEAEINRKNEQLERLNAERNKFFSIIAHDLRSPLSNFLAITQLMVEKLPEMKMERIQEITSSMNNAASNLFSLLENLLQWAIMQQGLIPFDPEVIQLNPIIDESISLFKEPAINKSIEIVCQIPEGIEVFADLNIFQTIIRNLVSNALKFTPKGGKVFLSAKTFNDFNVELSVKDTGIGIKQEMVDILFRLDTQYNRKGTEGEPSAGLGLLLCKEFVEKHKGRIWVETEEGKGSEFKFTLPSKHNLEGCKE